MSLQKDTNVKELEEHIREEIRNLDLRLNSNRFDVMNDDFFITKRNTLIEIIDLFFTV